MAAQWLLGILAAAAVLASEMPRPWAWLLAVAAFARGGWLARREAGQPVRSWIWPAQGAVILDGDAVEDVTLRWRGPLAFVRWRGRDGRVHRASWWPDTLDARARRELRLATVARTAAPAAGSVAP